MYGTQMLNDCPQELWDTLDAVAIAAEMGALVVKLNGPRYWMLDGLGQKVAVVDPVFRDFNGLMMRRIADRLALPKDGRFGHESSTRNWWSTRAPPLRRCCRTNSKTVTRSLRDPHIEGGHLRHRVERPCSTYWLSTTIARPDSPSEHQHRRLVAE